MVTWNNVRRSHIAAAAITAALSIAISPAWVALAEEPADDQAAVQMDSTFVSSVGHTLSSDGDSGFFCNLDACGCRQRSKCAALW